jgi:putative membrane protein
VIVVAVIASMVMTAWDTVMDPEMAAAGNWVWETGGPYFGVPLRNYFGWLLTTVVVYLGAGWIFNGKQPQRRQVGVETDITRGFAALPIIVYASFGLRYISAETIPALHVVALFAMGLPGLLALILTCMPRRVGEPA